MHSLALLLEELRARYEDEDLRREGADTKASILLTALGVIIAVLLAFPRPGIIFMTVALISLESAVAALLSIRLRDYDRVGGAYGDFYGYARLSQVDFADKFVLSYMNALEHNTQQTDRKQWLLSVSYNLLIVTLFGLAVLAILGGVAQ